MLIGAIYNLQTLASFAATISATRSCTYSCYCDALEIRSLEEKAFWGAPKDCGIGSPVRRYLQKS